LCGWFDGSVGDVGDKISNESLGVDSLVCGEEARPKPFGNLVIERIGRCGSRAGESRSIERLRFQVEESNQSG